MEKKRRKKSPRAPSMPLQEAIERTIKIYEKERRHPAPIDVIAQDIGYKSANNGAALSAIASLRYYGLLDRPQEGVLAVVKEVEDYKFSPDDQLRHKLIIGWLRTPPLFTELLDKYQGGLPSDANIKFDLVQREFNPETADACVSVFRQSVEFANYFENTGAALALGSENVSPAPEALVRPSVESSSIPGLSSQETESPVTLANSDRIPVRLRNGRRAWIEIPSPFYASDKIRLKAQIDLILSDDEEDPD